MVAALSRTRRSIRRKYNRRSHTIYTVSLGRVYFTSELSPGGTTLITIISDTKVRKNQVRWLQNLYTFRNLSFLGGLAVLFWRNNYSKTCPCFKTRLAPWNNSGSSPCCVFVRLDLLVVKERKLSYSFLLFSVFLELQKFGCHTLERLGHLGYISLINVWVTGLCVEYFVWE
jgi:hypothetical protein